MHSETSFEAGAVFGLDKQGDVRRLTVNQNLVGIRFEQRIQGFAGFLTGGVYHISKRKRPSLNPRNVFTGLTYGIKKLFERPWRFSPAVSRSGLIVVACYCEVIREREKR
jgi:hypothetical protein